MLPTNVIEHWLNNTNANWIKVLRNHKNLKKIDKNHKQVLVCYEKRKKIDYESMNLNLLIQIIKMCTYEVKVKTCL